MTLGAGTRLGPYEIASPIGKGGMGEVYRARDTKLDRDVAIKVLPEEFADDDERLTRFEREAKLLASLNHPNIASIHGFQESDGVKALVLELVEGPTLAERIAEGPIPVDETVAIAKQIAEALEAGHEAGVIHRDLKPANIKLKEDGTVKVLDYGLAKALEGGAPSGADAELSQSPTLTRQGTQVGVILGTAAYMSPEQAKGKRVDQRTDVWSFGAVVFEMLAGERAFGGEDVSDTLAAVIRAEPSFDSLPSETPEALRRTLELCLTKDSKERVQAIGDVRLAMQGAFETETTGPSPTGWRPSPTTAAAAALLLSLVTGMAVLRLSRPVETPRPVSRSTIPFPAGVTWTRTGHHAVALSPDGSRLVYSANEQLYLRFMDQTDATPLMGTEGAMNPFFSPDGEWVGFWSEGQLQKVPIRGGAPVRLCEASDVAGVSWGADDAIVFGQFGVGIVQVSADGGTPDVLVPLTEAGQVGHSPQVLPGQNALLFTVGTSSNWNDARIVVQSLDTGERKVLVEGGFDARYLATGHLAYVHDGTLFAVPFDVDELAVKGGAVPVAEGIRFHNTSSGVGQFTVSDTGWLVYLPAGVDERHTLVWVDRNGREEAIAAEPRFYKFPRISPDGSRVALDVNDTDNDIWIWDFARETLTRLTFWPGVDVYPVWAPDGARVAFMSNREGHYDIFWKRADGAGTVERLTESETDFAVFPQAFTRDGTRLVFSERTGASRDLKLLSLDGSSEPLLTTVFDENIATISPDGRWLAYESNASGGFEIYIRPFPNVEEGQWLISRDGGTKPLWAPNGRELFYMAPGSRLMSVPVETEPGFAAGSATELFSGYFTGLPGPTYDISPDGERFLMIKETAGGNEAFILVQNWFSELERLAPTDD